MSRVREYVEIVIPTDYVFGIAGMPITLPLRVTNIMGSDMTVLATVSGLSCAPNSFDLGTIPAGTTRDIFLDDTMIKSSKPATNTEETITLALDYYIGGRHINTSYVYYTFVYVNFNDASYTVVDEDTFETDLGGWVRVDVVGTTTLARDNTECIRTTGQWSMKHSGIDAGDKSYLTKNFTIGAVDRAFFRACVWGFFDISSARFLLELITDAGEITEKRVVPIPLTSDNPHGDQIGDTKEGSWAYIGAKLPVNGTYEVQLKATGITGTVDLYYDDIKVVQS
jgi:hypothetical protein